MRLGVNQLSNHHPQCLDFSIQVITLCSDLYQPITLCIPLFSIIFINLCLACRQGLCEFLTEQRAQLLDLLCACDVPVCSWIQSMFTHPCFVLGLIVPEVDSLLIDLTLPM